jgi:hypothetical protein
MATAGHTTGSAPSSASSHLAIDSSPPQVGGGSCGGEGERQYDKNEIEGEKGLGAQELLEINNV